MAVDHAIICFIAAFILCRLIWMHSNAAGVPSVAGLKSPSSSPHFDSFVLFGQIYPYKEITRHKLQLSVELGYHVWRQNVESKYYTFQLPTGNFSGSLGRLSVLGCDDYATAFWSHSFTVQNDIGASRLDINVEEAIGAMSGQEHNVEDLCGSNNARVRRHGINVEGTVGITASQEQLLEAEIGTSKSKSKESSSKGRVEIEQVATPPMENHLGHSPQDTEVAVKVNIMPKESTLVLEIVYPQQLLLWSASLQKWHLAVLIICFGIVQLLNALVHKSISLLEASFLSGVQIPEGKVSTSSEASDAAWQSYQSSSLQMGRQFFDVINCGDARCAGSSPLEEAWHVAEQYLNKAMGNDCQGVYFSYNCATPQAQQERHESALGRWNRDNAGRLIRRLWSEELA